MFPSLSCIFHIILQWREPETCPGTDPRLSRWGADGKVLTFICWQEKGEAAKLPKLLRYFHLHGILWEYVHSYHGTMGRSLGKMGRSLGNMIHLYTLGYFMGSYGNMSIAIMGLWEDHWERWEDHWEIWYTFIHWDISWDPMGICP